MREQTERANDRRPALDLQMVDPIDHFARRTQNCHTIPQSINCATLFVTKRDAYVTLKSRIEPQNLLRHVKLIQVRDSYLSINNVVRVSTPIYQQEIESSDKIKEASEDRDH